MRTAIILALLVAGIVPDFGMPDSPADVPGKKLLQTTPEAVGLLSSHLDNIDDAVAAAIRDGEIPGAVVLVSRHGRIAYCRAFGNRPVTHRAP